MNVGIISGVGYLAYTKPRLRQDLRVVSGTVAGIFAIVGVEGYISKLYATGVESEKPRVASDNARILDLTKKHLLRPGVLGGFVGLGAFWGIFLYPHSIVNGLYSQRRGIGDPRICNVF